jgi:hypothetical protein
MPKDYSAGKIYKIEPISEHDEGDIYIGSTIRKYLCERMVKQSITININDKPKQKYTRRSKKEEATSSVIPVPVPAPVNYGSIQAAGHQMNSNVQWLPYNMPSITGESQAGDNLMNRIINQIEINGKDVNQIEKKEDQVKPQEQQPTTTTTQEAAKPAENIKETVTGVINEALNKNNEQEFTNNVVSNVIGGTVGTVGGVAVLSAGGYAYKNRNNLGTKIKGAFKGSKAGVAGAFQGIGQALGGVLKTPPYKKGYELLEDSRPSSVASTRRSSSAVSSAASSRPSSAVSSSSGFSGESTSFQVYRKNLEKNVAPSPSNYATTTENLADVFTNQSRASYRKKDGTIDLRKYMSKYAGMDSPSPTPQASVLQQITPPQGRRSAKPQSINFSPIAQAPTTQPQVRVRPQASRPGSRASSRASNASESSIRGLITPSQNVTIPNKTNPTPGISAFKTLKSKKFPEAPFSSPKPTKVSPAQGESILEQTQRSSYTPQNTEFVTKRKKTKSRAPTPASESSILDSTINVLSGGMLGSAKKSKGRRESSMLSQVTTLPTADYPSRGQEYRAGYNARMRLKPGEKPKKWSKDTDMRSAWAQGYYGNRTDDTIEKFVDKTPPPRRHANTKTGNTKPESPKNKPNTRSQK